MFKQIRRVVRFVPYADAAHWIWQAVPWLGSAIGTVVAGANNVMGWLNAFAPLGSFWYVLVFVALALCTAAVLFLVARAMYFFEQWRGNARTETRVDQNTGSRIADNAQTICVLSEDVRREFGGFVHTKLAEGRLPCTRIHSQLTRKLCLSKDLIKTWVGSGSVDAARKERDAWDALKGSIDSAKSYDELEEAFAEHYKAFVLLRIWIPRVAFTLGCLDAYRETQEFREASAANDKLYADILEFVMLKPRLRAEIQRWAHMNLMTYTPK